MTKQRNKRQRQKQRRNRGRGGRGRTFRPEDHDSSQEDEYLPGQDGTSLYGIKLPEYFLLDGAERKKYFARLNARFREQLQAMPSRPRGREVRFGETVQVGLFREEDAPRVLVREWQGLGGEG